MNQTRHTSRTPGAVGVASFRARAGLLGVPPLSWDALERLEAEADQAAAREAYLRGADRPRVFRLLWDLHRRRRGMLGRDGLSPVGRVERGFLDGELELPEAPELWIDSVVQTEGDRYDDLVAGEFRGLPPFVQRVFCDPSPSGPNQRKGHPAPGSPEWIANDRGYYLAMRPLYYLAGYTDPKGKIFDGIVEASLLGVPVGGGVHRILLPLLASIGPLLDSWSPGLAAQVAATVRAGGAGGFVPRRIAGSSELSNHAFGLAIDLAPGSNPHVVRGLVPLLDEVVRREGVDYSFGRPALGKGEAKGVGRADQAMEIWIRAQAASDAVKAFLGREVPRWLEWKAALARQTVCEPGTPDASDLEGDAGLALVDALVEATRQKGERTPEGRTVRGWMEEGIQSLPLALVVALVTAGLRWGQEYSESKDAMHFELLGAIAPDAPRRDPALRDLEALAPIDPYRRL